MRKIIIISATSRPNSNTMKVSRIYANLLRSKNVDCEILDLTLLPENFISGELHGKRSPAFAEMIERYISGNTRFIFVVPEYNGSFPGVLKLFIDSLHPKEWAGKYACLVGVSVGRAGNLRGLDQLSAILNYLKMHVYYNKLPISIVDKLLAGNDIFSNDEQLKACETQTEGFLEWTGGHLTA